MPHIAAGTEKRIPFIKSGLTSYAVSLLCGTAVALSAGTAIAQEAQPSNVAASQPDGDVADIVVTARRKSESLTQVPAAISSVSSDFIQKQNIQNFADYATKVPNLSFQYGGEGGGTWADSRSTVIRGVVGSETTAYYIDDTPVPDSVSPQVLNLERIEVLKGPQGTLFGASSMGGNLRYITKKPSLTDNEGMIRVQGGHTKSGGFDYDLNAQNNFVLVPDQLSVNAAVGYMQESGFVTRRYPDASGNLVSDDDQGRNRVLSGSVAIRAQFSDELSATFSALGQRTRLHGFPGVFLSPQTYRPTTYTNDRDANVQEFARDDWALGSAVLNYDGEGFDIVSSNSFFSRNIFQLDDNTEATNFFLNVVIESPLGDPTIYYTSFSKERRYTHETRLSFDDGTILPGLSGIIGVFYQNKWTNGGNPGIFLQPLADQGFPYPYMADVITKTKTRNSAVFGELYYKVVPKLTVTLGLRQYWLKQTQGDAFQSGLLFGPEGKTAEAVSGKESGLIPKAVLSYEIGDRGNVYVSAAKGFRPGSPASPLPEFCRSAAEASGLSMDGRGSTSDTLWSYEVGAKSRFAGGRINASAAAFRMDWTDIQQSLTLPQPCGLQVATNAGKARINGAEFELGGRPIANVPFTLQLGLGYTDAKLIDPGILVNAAPNSRLLLVPKWTASVSGYYETPVSNTVDFFVAADYSYTSSARVPTVGDTTAAFVVRPPINLVNANFGFRFGKSQVMFYAKNVFDKRLAFGAQQSSGFERYDEFGSLQLRGAVSRPRQLGVQFQVGF
jgi:outer membrane receptor protein involved in Fe transport